MLNRFPYVTVLAVLFAASFFFAPAAKADEAKILRFGWKLPLKFGVEEKITQKGKTSRIRHTFGINETNGELVLRWLDVKFLSVDGQLADSPEMQKAVRPGEALFLANPYMRIGLRGKFLGVSRSKESIKEINDLLDKFFPDRPDEARKFYVKMSERPEGENLMGAVLANRYWMPWVGVWIGLVIEPGQSITNESLLPFGGTECLSKGIFTELPTDGSNEIHLRYQQTASGPEVGKALSGLVNSFPAPENKKSIEPFPPIKEARIQTILEVKTNPLTLQPSWAKRMVETKMQTEGETVISKEYYEFTFYWE